MRTIMMNSESNQAKDIKLAYLAIRDSRMPMRSVNDIVKAINGKGSDSMRRNIYHLINSPDNVIARSVINGEVRYTVARPLGDRIAIERVTDIKRPRRRKVVVRSSYTNAESKTGRMYNVMHLVVSTLGPYEDSSDLFQDCRKEYEALYNELLPKEATFSAALTTMIIALNGTITGERGTEKARWRNIRLRENGPTDLPEVLNWEVGIDRRGAPLPLQTSLNLEATTPTPVKPSLPPPPPPPPPAEAVSRTLPMANNMADAELEAWCGSLSIKTAKAIQRIITKLLED